VFDVNGTGQIEPEQLQQALASSGRVLTQTQVKDLIKTVDANKDGKLNFEEFIAWNRHMFLDQMKADFQAIDVDGSGYIDKVELKAMALKLNFGVTEEELDDLTYEMDANQNDRIGLDEFIVGMVRMHISFSHPALYFVQSFSIPFFLNARGVYFDK
jgi:Ca2+-binding EF-hand superfamily protein